MSGTTASSDPRWQETASSGARSFLAGLVGEGIGPSLTPPMHEREAHDLGRRLIYRTIDIHEQRLPPEAVGDLIRAAPHFGFDGLNITHPCKQLALQHLDVLSPEAQALGAVNTVVFDDGKAVGHNTDWSGFAGSLELGLASATRERVVLLGAGGAGSAVAHALLTTGTRELLIVDVKSGRANALAQRLAHHFPEARCRVLVPEEVGPGLESSHGLVNATPTGMAHHPGVPVPVEYLRPHLWVADIVYRPLRTELLREATHRGCVTLNGGLMAVLQAVEAFELITGLTPDRKRMQAHFTSLTGD